MGRPFPKRSASRQRHGPSHKHLYPAVHVRCATLNFSASPWKAENFNMVQQACTAGHMPMCEWPCPVCCAGEMLWVLYTQLRTVINFASTPSVHPFVFKAAPQPRLCIVPHNNDSVRLYPHPSHNGIPQHSTAQRTCSSSPTLPPHPTQQQPRTLHPTQHSSTAQD